MKLLRPLLLATLSLPALAHASEPDLAPALEVTVRHGKLGVTTKASARGQRGLLPGAGEQVRVRVTRQDARTEIAAMLAGELTPVASNDTQDAEATITQVGAPRAVHVPLQPDPLSFLADSARPELARR